ncbi:hypothetical protein D3C72_1136580 [compost metagenome]
MAQAGQRRAGEPIEGTPARDAAVALQAVRMAVPMQVRRVAGGTGQSRLRHIFQQCDGRVVWRAATQQGNACLPLALAQLSKLRNQGDPFGWPHDLLPV